MPIKNLTDRPPAFPRIGELRKGAPKEKDSKRPGADLHHFRFTPTDPKDTRLAKQFVEIFGVQPRFVYILLPYQTPEENLDAWQEEWTAGSLKHRCDGERCVLELDEGGKHYILNSGKPCPGNCKASGRLSVILPALKRAGIVSVLTTSKNDLLNLSRSLQSAFQLRGDLRGIPFALSRAPRLISTPGENGRVRREKWLLHLEIAPQWFERQLESLQVSALPQVVNEPLLLEAGYEETEDEDETESPPTPTNSRPLATKPSPAGSTPTSLSNPAPDDSRPSSPTITGSMGRSETTTTPTAEPSLDDLWAYDEWLVGLAENHGLKDFGQADRRAGQSPEGHIKYLQGKLDAQKKGSYLTYEEWESERNSLRPESNEVTQ